MNRALAQLTWQAPVDESDKALTRDEIGEALRSRPHMWAVVARPDRKARADALADRINRGGEYGPDFEAQVVKVVPEFRVYARSVAQ